MVAESNRYNLGEKFANDTIDIDELELYTMLNTNMNTGLYEREFILRFQNLFIGSDDDDTVCDDKPEGGKVRFADENIIHQLEDENEIGLIKPKIDRAIERTMKNFEREEERRLVYEEDVVEKFYLKGLFETRAELNFLAGNARVTKGPDREAILKQELYRKVSLGS